MFVSGRVTPELFPGGQRGHWGGHLGPRDPAFEQDEATPLRNDLVGRSFESAGRFMPFIAWYPIPMTDPWDDGIFN